MKTILLLLALALPCAAQEIKVNQVSAEELLGYLDINPQSVRFTNFSITFPAEMRGVLEYRETSPGKEPKVLKTPLGPASVFKIEVFLGQDDPKTQTRIVRHKFSAGGITISGQHVIFLRDPGVSAKHEYMMSATLPVFFSYTVGDVTQTLSFSASPASSEK